MASLQVIQWAGSVTGLLFIFALGAIVGSFINVLAYRLPRGMNIVTPPSRCPSCGTKLRWSENFPILGWLWLRGRCRFCKSPISPEYPIVELTVALLFALLHAMWFMDPSILTPLGVSVRALRPEWAEAGLRHMWPMDGLVLLLIASLVAMTIIDAKTFTIPLALPWVVAGVALVTHPVHALWVQESIGLIRGAHRWTIPTTDWAWLGAALGAGVGLCLALGLLLRGLLPRSFDDYDRWEKSTEAARAHATSANGQTGGDGPPQRIPFGPILVRTVLLTGPAIALMFVGFAVGLRMDAPLRGMLLGMVGGLVIGVVLRRLGPGDAGGEEPLWVQYPHARREVLKELLFLAPAAALGLGGWWVGVRIGAPWTVNALTGVSEAASAPPLWLAALGGSVLGVLAGGGIVWAFRILGTLALGREAMGLGDVHLMAAVGAVLGWVDPLLAFFVAPVFGIGAALLSTVLGSVFRRQGTALPYGPSLALATLLVIYAKPLFEWGLGALLHTPVNLP